DQPGTATWRRRRRAAMDDAIAIAPPHGGEAGVERLGDDLGRDHRDRRRLEMEVDGVADPVGCRLAGEVEMDALAERMDPGVGPAGGLRVYGLAAEGEDRLLQRLLHRRAVLLALPADEAAAVIFQGQLEAGHGRTVPAGRS